MDVLRSCYSSTWHLPGVGDVEGYYYFRPDGTPFYGDWSFVGSRNWHQGDSTPWPEFGEKENVRQKWRDGSFAVTPTPDLRIVGTPQCLGGTNPPRGAVVLVHGVDRRCWAGAVELDTTAAGGDLAGGSSDSWVEEEGDGEGGDMAGGASVTTFDLTADGEGGDLVGGESVTTFDLTGEGQGGDKVGGTSDATVEYEGDGQGGDKAGGSSITWPVGQGQPGVGKMKDGGSSTSSKTP